MFLEIRAYSQDLRDIVISKYKTGNYKIIELARLFHIGRHTISDWIGRYKEHGDYRSKQHFQTGRIVNHSALQMQGLRLRHQCLSYS